MKRTMWFALVTSFYALAAAASASAQVTLGVHGGVTFPTADYGDKNITGAKTGWLGHVDVGIPVGDNGLAVGASGYYGSNSHQTSGEKTNLLGGLGFVAYNFSTGGSVTPSVFGLIGSLTHQYRNDTDSSQNSSDTGLAYGGGAGLGFPLGGVTGMIEAWYLTAKIGTDPYKETDAIFGVDIGVEFALGGGGM